MNLKNIFLNLINNAVFGKNNGECKKTQIY